MSTGRPLDHRTRRAVIAAHLDGVAPQDEIARRMGVGQTTVSRVLREAFAAPDGPAAYGRRAGDIHALAATHGIAQRRIGEAYGISQGRVAEIIGAERRRRISCGLRPLEATEEASVGPEPSEDPRPWPPLRRARLVPTRVIGWGVGPEVEALDPAVAAADSAPLWGGRYPRAPRVAMSQGSSPAGLCADLGG